MMKINSILALPTAIGISTAGAMAAADQPEVNVIFSSPETQAVYAELFKPADAHALEDTHIIVLTPRDVYPDGYDPETHDFASLGGSCGYFEDTTATDNARVVLEEAYENIAGIVWEHIDAGRFPVGDALLGLARAKPQDYSTIFSSFSAITGAATALSINPLLDLPEDYNQTFAIMTLPNELPDPVEDAASLAGGDPKYLTNIIGTGKDAAIFTIGHELGHIINQDSSPDAPHFCTGIDIPYILDGNIEESLADIAGAQFLRTAQNMGIASDAEVTSQQHAMRSLALLWNRSNALFTKNTEQSPSHQTSYVFDPNQPDYNSGLDLEENPYFYKTAMTINVFADMIAGYLKTKESMRLLNEDPTQFTEEEAENIRTNFGTADEIALYTKWYSEFGQSARIYEGRKDLHHAAMVFLKESGALDQIRFHLSPQYKVFHDDAVHDYFSAVAGYGSSLLTDTPAHQDVSALLGEEFSLEGLIADYYSPSQEPASNLTLE